MVQPESMSPKPTHKWLDLSKTKTFDLIGIPLLYWDTHPRFESTTELLFDPVIPVVDTSNKQKSTLLGSCVVYLEPYTESWVMRGNVFIKYDHPLRVAVEESLVVPEIVGVDLESKIEQDPYFETVTKFWVVGLTFKSADSKVDQRLKLLK